MPKQLVLSALIELPDGYFEAASLSLKLSVPWLALCSELDAAGVKHTTKVDEIEVRAKQQRAPRKPRVVAPASEAA